MFVSSNNLSAQKSFLVCNLGIELARRNLSVGLIETTSGPPNIFSFFPASARKECVSSLKKEWSTIFKPYPAYERVELINISVGTCKQMKAVLFDENLKSGHFFAFLKALRNESDFVIINASHNIFELRKMISFLNPFLTVVSTVDPEELLDAYLVIKEIRQRASCGEVGIVIMEEDLSQKADAAFRVIAEMVDKFLPCKVRLIGTTCKRSDVTTSAQTDNTSFLQQSKSSLSQSIRKLADNLIRNIVT